MKTWPESAVERARQRLTEEPQLLKEVYSPEFAKLARETGLYFSFGDIVHLIGAGISDGMTLKRYGAAMMLAYYESLIKRFKLYLLRELELVVNDKPPFESQSHRGPDFNFISEFLEQLDRLDRLAEELKELRKQDE